MVQVVQLYAFLALLCTSTLAASHGLRRANYQHNDLVNRTGSDSQLHPRDASNVDSTWYRPAAGGNEVSCGGHYGNDAAIVAMSAATMNRGLCGRRIVITANGRTREATIMDTCQICGPWGLDLTEGLFSSFASTGQGRIRLDWKFWTPPPPPPPRPKPTPRPPPPPRPTPTPRPTTRSTASSTRSTTSATETETSDNPAPTSASNDTTSNDVEPSNVPFGVLTGTLEIEDGTTGGNLYLMNTNYLQVVALAMSSRGTG